MIDDKGDTNEGHTAAMIPQSGTLLIGYGRRGWSLQAEDPQDRETLVDLFLANPDTKRSLTLAFRPGASMPQEWGAAGDSYAGHLTVGIVGDEGAAVFYRKSDDRSEAIRATQGEMSSTEPTNVIFDDHAAMYFLRNRIVPKDILRAAMAEYALTGDIVESADFTPFWPEDETFEPGAGDTSIGLQQTGPHRLDPDPSNIPF